MRAERRRGVAAAVDERCVAMVYFRPLGQATKAQSHSQGLAILCGVDGDKIAATCAVSTSRPLQRHKILRDVGLESNVLNCGRRSIPTSRRFSLRWRIGWPGGCRAQRNQARSHFRQKTGGPYLVACECRSAKAYLGYRESSWCIQILAIDTFLTTWSVP